ncbi:acetylornithine deacetylase [Stappia stellulata]|uniref:acetylornithine deacetylase n=1 Tax=Stappia stellulata TaxID=71235 RepID=UPI00048B9168|nr:acetylornithine deacetylase [Stappia stellulata]
MPTRYSAQEMLARLVAFPTVSSASNLDLISFAEDFLSGHGVASTRVYDETGTKAALHACIGPRVDGGVVLSAHTDVVPVEGQAWTRDPFALSEEGGRLYGRGTCDMKGFAALMLAGVPDMVKADLKRPIHLALSYDEEVGCLGAPPMIEDMMSDGPRPDCVIVGEPSMMKVITGHKGTSLLKVTVRGHSVHSSQWERGVSAVANAARIVTWLDDRTRENRDNADRDLPFDPPFTTLHCGMIEGGTAANIVSKHCEFVTDIRSLPDETIDMWQERLETYVAQQIVPEMKRVNPQADVTIERLAHVPPLMPEENGAAETMARRLTGDNGEHMVVYGTEAGQFQARGLSAVVCGPGSIDQAHQPDEFIDLGQLRAGEAFVARLIDTMSEG